jgi:hypothetical protein
MATISRNFEVQDPTGKTWTAEFRWLQNAISIRHADAIDIKYYVDGEEDRREVVVALPHRDLVELAAEQGRDLTDAWCMGLAQRQLERMIREWDDMDKPLITLSRARLAELAAGLASEAATAVSRAALQR